MADLSTDAGPLDDHSKAQHLTQLQTTLQALAGTGLFTQKDAAQYFTQIARLVHIELAAQCSMHTNININTDNTASNLGEGQSSDLEYINEESSKSEGATSSHDGSLVRPRKRDTIRNLKRMFPKWAILLAKKSKLNLKQGA